MDNDILFSKCVIIGIKESHHTLTKRLELNVEVECHRSLCRKEVIIRIRDDNDPFFLFLSSINEEDFERIKSSQGLLIDFGAFPQKFIDLLETCFEDQNKTDPKFVLSLTVSKDRSPIATLEVIEVNPFKHLSHLSLKVPSANDSIIRSSLNCTLRRLKNENEKLQFNLNNVQMQLNENITSKGKEIERMKSEYELLLRESESRFRDEIECEKRKVRDIITKESENMCIIEQLQRKLTASEESLRREQRLRMDNDLQTNNEYAERNMSLKAQLNEKDDELKKAHESLVSELNERLKVVEICDEKENIITKHEETIDQLKDDLSKANDIIRKLQSEVKSTHSKLDLLNKVASKQDEVVGAKESRVKKLESDLRHCAEQIKVKEKEYTILRKELDSLRSTFEESQTHAKTNENLIAYLNKQLNELQTKHGIKSNITGKTVPTKSGQLPHVNLVNRPSGKTDPKTIAQRNALFVSGGPRICDPFK